MHAELKRIGCEFQSEEFLCNLAHAPLSYHRKGVWSKFKCPCCAYSPNKKQFLLDVKRFDALSDEERKQERKDHVELGNHFHQELLMLPLQHFGMDRMGVDQLHLVYLNFFKHIFRYTIHEGLPDTKKTIIADYLSGAGFYSYNAISIEDDPVKCWIGREVKRFLQEAHMHLPFMLRIANAPIDVLEGDAAELDGADGAGYDEDDEYAPTDEELAAEADEEPQMVKHAQVWDHFLNWVREIQSPWDAADTDTYRQTRAVRWFNLSRQCSRDLRALKPTGMTWVPHIACNIVTRQILSMGDPSRRSADSCESFGAMVKKVIKHLTCRRRRLAPGQAVRHHRGSKLWSQTFKRGYVEQCFRRTCVRTTLLHGEENEPYLEASHWKLKQTGRSTQSAIPKQSCEVQVEHMVRIMMAAEADVEALP